jgi:hypothetical protein
LDPNLGAKMGSYSFAHPEGAGAEGYESS